MTTSKTVSWVRPLLLQSLSLTSLTLVALVTHCSQTRAPARDLRTDAPVALGDANPEASLPPLHVEAGQDAAGVEASADTSVVPMQSARTEADTGLFGIQLLGRFTPRRTGTVVCGFAGCALQVRAKATRVVIRMQPGWANRFLLTVDGKEARRFSAAEANGDVVLYEGEASEAHTLAMTRLTESGFGNWAIEALRVEGGNLEPLPPLARRHIEFIGDSITCGAGNLGTYARCLLDDKTEDVTAAYAVLAAEKVSATYTSVCVSGKGVYRDAAGFTSHPMPLMWHRTDIKQQGPLWSTALMRIATERRESRYESQTLLSLASTAGSPGSQEDAGATDAAPSGQVDRAISVPSANTFDVVLAPFAGTNDRPRWATRTPDTVVINLGTNDVAKDYERDRFIAGHESFYRTLRAVYPEARFVYLFGGVQVTPNAEKGRRDLAQWVAKKKEEATKAAGAGKPHLAVDYVQVEPPTSNEGFGCAFHPSLKTHARMAETLAEVLKK
jgi:Carbohydrate esterase 2 N-terminal/GDSL-like Lipase/Acylhydrolase family